MTHRRLALGAAGEEQAAAHLARSGYRILARNARAAGVEIDIVAARGDWIVFVEVKARSSSAFGGAAAAVDARKQARLVRAAQAWLHEHRPRARRARFDVIAWEWQGVRGWQLTHFEAAFEAGS